MLWVGVMAGGGVGTCLVCGWPRFKPCHPMWSPKRHQEESLDIVGCALLPQPKKHKYSAQHLLKISCEDLFYPPSPRFA